MVELNLDGLVGPTHNYAGLAHGNVASKSFGGSRSHPRDAALQGITKMAFVRDLGVSQAVLPPHDRPRLDVLRQLGFVGDDRGLVAAAQKAAPHLLASVYSASPMWTANAATVTASADAEDSKVHFTPANLASSFHRSLETAQTGRALRRIFEGNAFFHHDPLPSNAAFGDEGAANHTRLTTSDGTGLELHVYGRRAFSQGEQPKKFPARQTLEACEALARRHRVRQALFLQQKPEVIDAGVFHNDVIAVGHADRLLLHESAFADPNALAQLERTFAALGGELAVFKVSEEMLSVSEAVQTYLFNSQLLRTSDGWVLLAPSECEANEKARAVTQAIVEDGFVDRVHVIDLRESMQNGGGPACLRLRVPLEEGELGAVKRSTILDAELEARLRRWVEQHHRAELAPTDLADPDLIVECRTALDELTQILDLGSDFYQFQRSS